MEALDILILKISFIIILASKLTDIIEKLRVEGIIICQQSWRKIKPCQNEKTLLPKTDKNVFYSFLYIINDLLKVI